MTDQGNGLVFFFFKNLVLKLALTFEKLVMETIDTFVGPLHDLKPCAEKIACYTFQSNKMRFNIC